MTGPMNFREILKMLNKRKFLIFFITLSAVLIVGLYISVIRTPVYQATAEVLLVQKERSSEASSQSFSNIETYREMIKSPVILLKVKEKLELPFSFEKLSKEVTVGNPRNSQVLIIQVKNSDIFTAANIANEITEELRKKENLLMSSANVTVLSRASGSENIQAIGLGLLGSISIAAIAGIILGVGMSFLLEYTSNTVHTEKEVSEILDLPVLGVVSFAKEKKRIKKRYSNKRNYKKAGLYIRNKLESTIQDNS